MAFILSAANRGKTDPTKSQAPQKLAKSTL